MFVCMSVSMYVCTNVRMHCASIPCLYLTQHTAIVVFYVVGKYQDARSILETALGALGIDLFSGLVPEAVSSAFNTSADPTASAVLSPVAFRIEPSDGSAVSRDPTTVHAPAYLLHSDSDDSDGSSMSSGVCCDMA